MCIRTHFYITFELGFLAHYSIWFVVMQALFHRSSRLDIAEPRDRKRHARRILIGEHVRYNVAPLLC